MQGHRKGVCPRCSQAVFQLKPLGGLTKTQARVFPKQARYARRLAMWILAVAPHITLDTLADDEEKGRIREIQATAVAAKAQLTSFPCEAHIQRGL